MNVAQQLKTELENAAAELGMAPSTLGEKTGQGGHFYRRLCDGKRVWPETADAVRRQIEILRSLKQQAASPEAAE